MFFSYKGLLVELHKEIVAKAVGTETTESIAEYLRGQLVIGGRKGEKVMFNIGKLAPDWMREYNVKDVFEPGFVFNREAWFKESNHMRFVKENEKVEDHYVLN